MVASMLGKLCAMPKLVYHDSSGAAGTVEMGTQTILIGRAVECQIQTQDALVSRKHARVVYDGLYWIEDLGSSNGTFRRLVGPEPLRTVKLRMSLNVTREPRKPGVLTFARLLPMTSM